MKSKPETVWAELGFLPVDVGYCPNRKAWKKTLKQWKLDPYKYPDTSGRCTRWGDSGPNKRLVILITVSKKAKNFSQSQVVGIIAHECMHAWRWIRKDIGERKPSSEFEAYVLQVLVQVTVHAHQQSRRKPWKDT